MIPGSPEFRRTRTGLTRRGLPRPVLRNAHRRADYARPRRGHRLRGAAGRRSAQGAAPALSARYTGATARVLLYRSLALDIPQLGGLGLQLRRQGRWLLRVRTDRPPRRARDQLRTAPARAGADRRFGRPRPRLRARAGGCRQPQLGDRRPDSDRRPALRDLRQRQRTGTGGGAGNPDRARLPLGPRAGCPDRRRSKHPGPRHNPRPHLLARRDHRRRRGHPRAGALAGKEFTTPPRDDRRGRLRHGPDRRGALLGLRAGTSRCELQRRIPRARRPGPARRQRLGQPPIRADPRGAVPALEPGPRDRPPHSPQRRGSQLPLGGSPPGG